MVHWLLFFCITMPDWHSVALMQNIDSKNIVQYLLELIAV